MVRVARGILVFLIVVALAVVAGALVPRPLLPQASEGERDRRILLISNPIHTDIAIPIDTRLLERFAFLNADGVPADNPEAEWLIFGWGGRAFYLETPTWGDLKPMPVLKALTVDSSVMHVDVVGEIPEPHPAVTVFTVHDTGFEQLVDFIVDSFKVADGEPMVIAGAAYGVSDRFYEAHGSFNALVGCNTWTARALREAGLQTGWWNPLPATLSISLDLYN